MINRVGLFSFSQQSFTKEFEKVLVICSSKPVSGEYIAFCNHYKRVGWPKKKCVNPHLQIDFHLQPPHIACTLRFILALVAFVRLVQLSCTTTVRGCISSQLQSSNHWKVKGYKLAIHSLCVNNLDFAISGTFGISWWNITEYDIMVDSDWLFVYRRSQLEVA